MKSFHEWVKSINEAFAHPVRLGALSDADTMQFAMAIYKILHNQADVAEWRLLDKQIHDYGLDEVVSWIGTILEMNGIDEKQIEAEKAWFKRELARGMN